MEAPPSLSSSLGVLRRHRLRATTVCCFVGGSGGLGLGERLRLRLRWRRRACAGDFRYDPLSYALNFDEGDHGVDGDEDRAGGRLDAFLLSSQLTRRPGAAAAVEAA